MIVPVLAAMRNRRGRSAPKGPMRLDEEDPMTVFLLGTGVGILPAVAVLFYLDFVAGGALGEIVSFGGTILALALCGWRLPHGVRTAGRLLQRALLAGTALWLAAPLVGILVVSNQFGGPPARPDALPQALAQVLARGSFTMAWITMMGTFMAVLYLFAFTLLATAERRRSARERAAASKNDP